MWFINLSWAMVGPVLLYNYYKKTMKLLEQVTDQAANIISELNKSTKAFIKTVNLNSWK